MSELRVVHLSFHRDVERRGGRRLLDAWPTLVHVASAAAKNGCLVDLVVPGEKDEQTTADGVGVHFVESRSLLDIASMRLASKLSGAGRLIARVASLQPTVVHVAGFSYPLQLQALRRRLPAPAILLQDHASAPAIGWRRRVHQRAFGCADAVAFTAQEQAGPFFDSGLFRQDLPVFEVLEDSSFFQPGDQAAAQAETGIHGDPCLLWLGRLDSVKDPLCVLDAVSIASDRLPGLRMWCCYKQAPLEVQVRARIASDLRLRDRVTLLGSRPHAEIEALCRAADFLIQGSTREGSGYAVIEALACGTTPIVTDLPALRKITRQGRFGALAQPGASGDMARRLVDWASRERAELRRTARGHFEANLSYDVIGKDLRAAYAVLAAGR